MKTTIFERSIVLVIIFLVAFFRPAIGNPAHREDTAQTVKERNSTTDVSGPDLEIIRKRIVDDLLAPPVELKSITALVKSIQPDGSWPGINYKDTSRTGFQHSEHLEHMLDLAKAFKKPGSMFYNDPAVKKTFSSALDFWIINDFICENWWWNEMGTPNWIINTLLVMDTDLTEKQRVEGARIAARARLDGFGARPGGDLLPIAGMLGKQGLFKRDETILERAVEVIASEIKISEGRGLQPDLSFHHRVDNVISIHTYGTSYASSFAYWAVKAAGTKFKLPEDKTKLLIDYYLDGICRAMAYGKYPDPGAKNRDISRQGTLDAAGTELPKNLMLASDYRKKELQDLVMIRRGEKRPDLTWDRFFWHSEYFTHQRKNFFTSARMYSSRQNNMEEPYNEEGLRNHHYADGSNFITRTGKEYVDIFPVWDWQKIPGTTVIQKPALPHWKEIAKKGLTDFVGGVSDGEFGVAAFDFRSVHDPLSARKSWFFFDREYVCLGAGINAETKHSVATTLNQCLLNNDVIAKTKSGIETLKKGQHILQDVSWVFHDSIAYIFPLQASVNISNATATGNWRLINHQHEATEDPVQKEVFTVWLDHGSKPHGAGYAYTVVPGISAAAIDQYNNRSGVIILANTPEIQAVQNTALNTTGIVFYKAGTLKLPAGLSLTVNGACLVIMRTRGEKIEEIAVSDPTRKAKALELNITAQVERSGKSWRSAWNRQKNLSTVVVELPAAGEAGKSIIMDFSGKKG